jgi:hypothetical protein
MTTKQLLRSRGARSRATLFVAAMVASMAFTASAMALEPTGDFAVFKQCPRFTSGVELCLYSETLSGEVTLNTQTVPINEDKKHPIILQGGLTISETGENTFVGALNGETLSKTPQKVPGGLAGLIKCNEIKGTGLLEKAARAACELVFENKTTGVNAITELAKPASEIGISTSNLENAEGVALKLPVKVRLENSLLGSECYIGSNSNPMTLNLTAGTTAPPPPNTPIKGNTGKFAAKDEFEFIEVTNNKLVDNAFAAPEATGCGGIFAVLINPIVNAKLGLPSAAGKNTAIQNNYIREATTVGVIASEK